MKKLNKFIPLILLVSLALTGLSCEKERSKKREKEEYLTYKNEKWGFEIDYPEDWEKKILGEEAGGITVGFRIPAKDKESEEDFRENVVVLVGKPIPDKDFDELMEESLQDLPKMSGMALIEHSKVEVSGYPSYEIIYTELVETETYKYLHYFINAGNVWCQILYTAKHETYSDYLKEAQKMIRSFEINPFGQED